MIMPLKTHYACIAAFVLLMTVICTVESVPFSPASTKRAIVPPAGGHGRAIQRYSPNHADPLATPSGGGDVSDESSSTRLLWGLFLRGKRHPWFKTGPIFRPGAYPIIDVVAQLMIIGMIEGLGVSGPARRAIYAVIAAHLPLYLLTDYGARFPASFPVLSFLTMYLLDVGFVLYLTISPHLVEGYGDAKWIFTVVFGLSAVSLLALVDPKPGRGTE